HAGASHQRSRRASRASRSSAPSLSHEPYGTPATTGRGRSSVRAVSVSPCATTSTCRSLRARSERYARPNRRSVATRLSPPGGASVGAWEAIHSRYRSSAPPANAPKSMSPNASSISHGTSRPASASEAVSRARIAPLAMQTSNGNEESSRPSARACSRPVAVSGASPPTTPAAAVTLSPCRHSTTSSIHAQEPSGIVRDEHPHLALRHARLEQARADLPERVDRERVVRLPEVGAERRALGADPADPVDQHVDRPVVERRLFVVHAERVLDERAELRELLHLVLRRLDDEVRVV